MSDNWIPGIAPFMLRPLVPLTGGHTVDLLLAEDAWSWDEPTVRFVFVKELADKVLQILISRFDGEDFVCWPHNKLGVFSVRSAYNLARLDQAQVSRSAKWRGMTSDSVSESKFWKALWAIQAPGKMHITLWRFAHDCLSSGAQLCRRQVPASSACIHCSAEERIEHALLFCPFAREVWDEVKDSFDIHLNQRSFIKPRLWLFDFLAHCTKEAATILTVTFWHLWDARNKAREEEIIFHPSTLHHGPDVGAKNYRQKSLPLNWNRW